MLIKSGVYGALRTEVCIDEVVKAKVLEQVEAENEEFQNEYAAITALSDRIAEANQDYRTDPAQVLMATWCMTYTYSLSCAIAPPAAGKTFAFLLFSARCLEL